MDEALLAHVDGVEQIVVLGAGYDMRAALFAAQIGKRPVFEVDFPATQERKQRVLKAHADLDDRAVRVSIDFQTERLDDVLARAGFRAGRPTFFFWEGVSMYLRRAAVRATLQTLQRLGGPGSALTMDFWYLLDDPDVGSTLARMSGGLLHVVGEPITFGVHPEDCADFLARDGWRATDVASSDELRRRYVKDDRPIYRANVVVTAVRA
jgi:methyltransferase (TIGR00027 family)